MTYEEYKRDIEAVRKANAAYYAGEGEVTMTDPEYDRLMAALAEAEKEHPEWAENGSPVSTVGDDRNAGFAKVAHKVPMLSIQDVFEKEAGDFSEAYDWYKACLAATGDKYAEFRVEPKIDGCAASVTYDAEGNLVRVVTRGNGEVGDDITRNVAGIPGLPESVGYIGEEIELRGEIVMYTSDFNKLNEARREAGLPLFANPRNTVAGTIKSLDREAIADRKLHFVVHGAPSGGFLNLASIIPDELDLVQGECSPLCLADSEEFGKGAIPIMKDMLDRVSANRRDYPYEIDGAVVKMISSNIREQLGCTSKFPRWACAVKFRAEQKETVLKGVTLQVGRTGVITPVAELEPVYISGSTVSRATLHNQDEIDRKDLHVGDTVIVEKAGEIIPAVVGVVKELRPENAVKVNIMNLCGGACPCCGEPLSRGDGTAIRCMNPLCKAQTETRVTHMLGKNGFDIKGIGPKVVSVLCTYFIKSPVDLVCKPVNATEDTIGMGANGSVLGVNHLQAMRSIYGRTGRSPLEVWLAAIGIPRVGKETAKEIASVCKDASSLEKAVHSRSLAKTIGPAAEESLFWWAVSSEGMEYINVMKQRGIVSGCYLDDSSAEQAGPLSGMVFVVTGKLSSPRDVFESKIKSAGGKFATSVTSATTHLLAGEGGGSKRTKAAKLGVKVINEEEFSKMIETK